MLGVLVGVFLMVQMVWFGIGVVVCVILVLGVGLKCHQVVRLLLSVVEQHHLIVRVVTEVSLMVTVHDMWLMCKLLLIL